MTVTLRLLSTHQGNKPGTIITVDDATGAALLKGGVNATTDLTGGTPYVAPPAVNTRVPALVEVTPAGDIVGVVTSSGQSAGAGGSAAPTTPKVLYKDLPLASTKAAGTEYIVTDYPLYAGHGGLKVVSDGVVWAPSGGALKVMQQCVTRPGASSMAAQSATNTGGYDSFNQAVATKVKGPVSGLRLLFSNTLNKSQSIDANPSDQPVTMEVSITVAPGTAGAKTVRCYWDDGTESKKIMPGAEAWCAADGMYLADGTIIAINTHGKFDAAPAILPQNQYPSAGLMLSAPQGTYAALSYAGAIDANDRGTPASSVLDKTMATMPTTRAGINASTMPPKMIVGEKKRSPTVVIFGDSNRAWMADGLAIAGIPFADWGIGSYKTTDLVDHQTFRFKGLRDAGFTHAMINLAGGDFTGGTPLATVQANIQTIAQMCKDMGLVPIFSTSPPKATAAANAAPGPQWTSIQPYNVWLRANNGSGFGYFDLFPNWGVEATGLWRADIPGVANGAQTADGIHATSLVHKVAAEAFALVAPSLFK